MVQALVNIDDGTNKVLNIVKAKYGFKDKGEAIRFVVNKYAEDANEPELKEEFVQKILAMEKQKSIRVDDFAKKYGLK
jgi:mannitol/fructose-specific phosphotransferase system IIA component